MRRRPGEGNCLPGPGPLSHNTGHADSQPATPVVQPPRPNIAMAGETETFPGYQTWKQWRWLSYQDQGLVRRLPGIAVTVRTLICNAGRVLWRCQPHRRDIVIPGRRGEEARWRNASRHIVRFAKIFTCAQLVFFICLGSEDRVAGQLTIRND